MSHPDLIEACPFCGDGDPAIDEIELGIWAVCCNECKTIGPHQDGEQSAEQAIAKWNDRASNSDPCIDCGSPGECKPGCPSRLP